MCLRGHRCEAGTHGATLSVWQSARTSNLTFEPKAEVWRHPRPRRAPEALPPGVLRLYIVSEYICSVLGSSLPHTAPTNHSELLGSTGSNKHYYPGSLATDTEPWCSRNQSNLSGQRNGVSHASLHVCRITSHVEIPAYSSSGAPAVGIDGCQCPM